MEFPKWQKVFIINHELEILSAVREASEDHDQSVQVVLCGRERSERQRNAPKLQVLVI
mgnify:CR=1 FL=1